MDKQSEVVAGLDSRVRGLCSPFIDDDSSYFLTGSCSLQKKNYVYLIEFRHKNKTCLKSALAFDEIVWGVNCSKIPNQLVSVISSKNAREKRARIYRISKNNEFRMENVAEIPNECLEIDWHSVNENHILALSSRHIKVYDITDPSRELNNFDTAHGTGFAGGIKWNPHASSEMFLHYTEGTLNIGDLRTPKLQDSMLMNHQGFWINDVDFNPNIDNLVLMCGTDCFLRMYDLRNLKKTVMNRQDHTHWVTAARYNPIYDQMIVSCGSDHKVSLLYLPSYSSDRLFKAANTDFMIKKDSEDHLVGVSDVHDISVNNVVFSSSDSWIYSSISFDGRFVIHHIPKQIKLKILL